MVSVDLGVNSGEQRSRLECLSSVNAWGRIDANEVCHVALGNSLRWQEFRSVYVERGIWKNVVGAVLPVHTF